ncbi:MAG: type I DNA topoisomerase [Chloroflexi bacterium]|nr:type I DNA topoisomerase [Chloroflexota bacterium]
MSKEKQLQAYCVSCQRKRNIVDIKPVFTANGRPGSQGVCEVCGTNMFRMGATAAHEGMTPPEPQESKPRKRKGKTTRSTRKRRSGKLVIVESPAKARTIEHYLGKQFKVKASVGHVRDLLKSQLSVDLENDFEPRYRVPNDKREVVKDLKAAVEQAEEVYLATDPDREGEAIAWHVMAATGVEEERAHRVVFNEITRDAVQAAFDNPRTIDMDRVNAQQTRRILDRLVGYELSPLLWEKIRPRLSAGRVQSVAVRLIVERERAIDTFVPEEYWTVDVELARSEEGDDPERGTFTARLINIHGEGIDLPTQGSVEPVVADLEQSVYAVDEIKRGTRRRKASAPFITSTLQQEASRRLGFTARKTMSIAQQLYEGVDIGGEDGVTGLITYMRTDSTSVADVAQQEALRYIVEVFGEDYVPESPNTYSKKVKGAQEAHEAIRPTGTYRTPEALKEFLSRDQFRLYKLIWQRFVASQMTPAVYDTLRVDVVAGPPGTLNGTRPYHLRASGSTLRFPGFLSVYADKYDEDNPADDDLDRQFPALVDGDDLDNLGVYPEQHFTQPPPRYTEASLVKALEEHGIGRPSTYAPILQTIQQRGYVTRDAKRLLPTETGIIVNDLLVDHFNEIVDLNFTAEMESDLDKIASGDMNHVPVLEAFYQPFKEQVVWAYEHIPNVDLGDERVGRACPVCGNDLVVRWGRYGRFIGCSNFPECRHTEPWLEKVGVTCPQCGGDIVERKTKRGRTFYGCSNYPECEFTSWKKPLPDPCPVCSSLLVVQNKKTAKCTNCEEQVPLETLPSQVNEQAESV